MYLIVNNVNNVYLIFLIKINNMQIHVPSMGVETINKQTKTTNKQAATMAYKIHKTQLRAATLA